MASVKGGQAPGSELAAGVSWGGLARGPWTVSQQHPSGSGGRDPGTDKPASTGCLPPLCFGEALHEHLQLQPRDGPSKQPGRKPAAALGKQVGRSRCLEPRGGEGPQPRDSKSQIRGLRDMGGSRGAGGRKIPSLLRTISAPTYCVTLNPLTFSAK